MLLGDFIMSEGISKEVIVKEAGSLIREKGISSFSMHALAALDGKTRRDAVLAIANACRV